MLLSHLEWLCIILPTLIAATPQITVRAQSSSLPDKLERDVPACAQPCLRRSLSEQFPLACTVPTDLSCLCSRYSFNGESLGEVCLGCIYASCSTYDHTAASAYNICFGQKNAVTPTKTVLTVPVRSSTASATMASSRPVVTTKPRSTITSTAHPSQPSPTNTAAVDSISLTPSPTSTISAAAAQDAPPKMKPAQIAGLSVAAGAAFIIAIGLMALSVFLRRRRERRSPVEVNEKRGFSPSPRDYSTRFSRGFSREMSSLEPPKRFPTLPVPVLRRPGESSTRPSNARVGFAPEKRTGPSVTEHNQPNVGSAADLRSIHPLFRPGAGNPNNPSDAVPLDQIGLAISAELPGRSTPPDVSKQPPRKPSIKPQRPRSLKRNSEFSQRPDSCVTESTVFEEDDVRRESRLLPMPPLPIPPIRSFQPSRPPAKFDGGRAVGAPTRARQPPQQPELFLNIPVRHSRSQPMPIMRKASPPRAAPVAPSQPAQRAQLAPPIQISTEYRPAPTSTSSPERSNGGDIPDYYFTAHQDPTSKYLTPSISPSRFHPQKESPKMVNIKPKLSSSTVSQATSRASTNVRDSMSSQTSFETADPNDPTPEDEDEDKRLSDNKLSPVAESPISNLRYPKVPRASNQLVPRSPRSPQSLKSQDSPRRHSPLRPPEPSTLLVKMRGEQGALQLESPFDSPGRAERRQHFQKYRQHLRSNSVETWVSSPVPTSERSTRTQSGLWPKSPAMYEPGVVRPLNVRSRPKMQPPPVEMQALKSPAWVPRLTPTRQGEDLLISVTYSKPGH